MVCWHDMERAICSMISEIGPRRWRSGSFIGSPAPGALPQAGMDRAFGRGHSEPCQAAGLGIDHNARTRQKLAPLVGKGSKTICGLLVSVIDETAVQLVWLRELICWISYALPIPWRMLSNKLVLLRLSDNDGTRSKWGGSSLKSGTPSPFESLGSS